MGTKYFGARVARLEENPALLTGRGPFVDDIQNTRRTARIFQHSTLRMPMPRFAGRQCGRAGMASVRHRVLHGG